MASQGDYLTLYTQQADVVIETVQKDGVAFSNMAYIHQKYDDVALVFEAAYRWFVKEAAQIVPPPPGAGTPYWAFVDPKYTSGTGHQVLCLRVPVEEIILFDLYEWMQVLQLRYLGESKKQEQDFRRELIERGIRNENDVVLSRFYPDLKAQVEKSWSRLFRHDYALKAGDLSAVGAVQAALWQIKAEWII